MQFRISRLLAIVFTVALSGAGCSTHRVKERMAYWETESSRYLPPGSTLQQAKDFFSSRGSSLLCCLRSPPQIPQAYYVLEHDVGFFLLTSYSVAVLVTLSDTDKVESVKVQRWGVGL
jgi:hypothetical protein